MSSTSDMPLILISATSAIMGALISSLVGPYLTQSKDRRSARANVIRSLTEVEKLRWGDSKYPELTSAITNLKSSGLIALADRQLVEYYSRLAVTSYRSAEKNFAEDGEEIWLLPSELVKHIDDSLEALSLTLWHPWRTKVRRSGLLKTLKRKESKLRKNKDIKWQ